MAPSPSSSSCSPAFCIVCADLLACNDWGHQRGSYVTQHRWYPVVSAGVECGCVSAELKVEGWALRLSSEWGSGACRGEVEPFDIGICLGLCPCTYMSWRESGTIKWTGSARRANSSIYPRQGKDNNKCK